MESATHSRFKPATFCGFAFVVAASAIPAASVQAGSRLYPADTCRPQDPSVYTYFYEGALFNEDTNVDIVFCPFPLDPATTNLKVTVYYQYRQKIPPNGAGRPGKLNCDITLVDAKSYVRASDYKSEDVGARNTGSRTLPGQFTMSLSRTSALQMGSLSCAVEAATPTLSYFLVAFEVDES